jgi:hypothetical protein
MINETLSKLEYLLCLCECPGNKKEFYLVKNPFILSLIIVVSLDFSCIPNLLLSFLHFELAPYRTWCINKKSSIIESDCCIDESATSKNLWIDLSLLQHGVGSLSHLWCNRPLKLYLSNQWLMSLCNVQCTVHETVRAFHSKQKLHL